MGVDAVKIGMLFDEPTIEAVAEALDLVGGAPVVVDPVMVAESGAVLLKPEAKRALIERILPRAAVATPNVAEARELTGLGDEAPPEELVRAVRALGPDAAVVTATPRTAPTASSTGSSSSWSRVPASRRRLPWLRMHILPRSPLAWRSGTARWRRPARLAGSPRMRWPTDWVESARGRTSGRTGHNRSMKLLRMTPGRATCCSRRATRR